MTSELLNGLSPAEAEQVLNSASERATVDAKSTAGVTLKSTPTVMRAKRSFMIATPRWPDDATSKEWRQCLTNRQARTDIVAALAAPPSPHRRQRKELWLGEHWQGACEEKH
jgi:hypothetical protein